MTPPAAKSAGPQYVVGIDLGTTNCVLAYAALPDESVKRGESPAVQLLELPQLVATQTTDAAPVLASFVYLGTDPEVSGGQLAVEGLTGGRKKSARPGYAVGQWARSQAAEVPTRTVGAAKSWLAHHHVDRHAAILPWDAPPDVPKISPVTASQYYLEHLRDCWNAQFPTAPLQDQQLVLTVPASFDPAARELTREAALAAGLPESLVLLEEPQAAVYDWLAARGDAWRQELQVGEHLLICDVGGGTTDLTLIEVAEQDGELELRRAAVGNHLLVGGDNMDLAIAHYVAQRFAEKGTKLDPWQSVALWHSCRTAKEKLLADGGAAKHPISVLGRGRKLIGGTIKVDVQREPIAQLLEEGFFPSCGSDDRPQQAPPSGFQQIGLPYEADPAITRHLAAFLSDHGSADGTPIRPVRVLFNGGVFKSDRFRNRLLEVLGGWSRKAAAPQLLEVQGDLDFAVARGAAYYGWVKRVGGVRIRGGTARSYYVGIETSGLAVPGAPRPLQAVCVVPFGMEEGDEADVPSGDIGLVVDQPAQFRFFSAATRKDDEVGQVLNHWADDELVETDPLEATLSSDSESDDSYVPVRFHSKVTELGMFELWCVATRSDQRWKLEFNVRDEAAG